MSQMIFISEMLTRIDSILKIASRENDYTLRRLGQVAKAGFDYSKKFE